MNPELRRNLWLEFSPHRLIAAPVVIALVLALVAAASTGNSLWYMAQVGGLGFGLAVLLWGTYLAGGSVSTEGRERTWDTQRMSAIGPWTMTWGKLIGSPAFAWYVGLLALLVFVVCGQAKPEVPVFRLALLLVMAALMLHAVALIASIYAARKQFRSRGASAFILVWLVAVVLVPGLRLTDQIGPAVAWWGATFDPLDFALASAGAFSAWAVAGAYRSMCAALEIRTRPWALPAFTLFAAVWMSGLLQAGWRDSFAGMFGVLLFAVLICGGFGYALLLAEPGGASTWQRLQVRLRARHLRRVLEEAPLWLVAVVTGLAMGVAALFTPAGNPDISRLLPLTVMLFVARDAAIFQFFALARQPRRAEAAALFYLVVLYALLPGFLIAIKAESLAHIVLPLPLSDAGVTTVIMLAQAGIAIAVARWRWKKVHAPDTAPAAPAARA